MHFLQGMETVQCSYPTAILSPDLSSQNMAETQFKIFAKRKGCESTRVLCIIKQGYSQAGAMKYAAYLTSNGQTAYITGQAG